MINKFLEELENVKELYKNGKFKEATEKAISVRNKLYKYAFDNEDDIALEKAEEANISFIVSNSKSVILDSMELNKQFYAIIKSSYNKNPQITLDFILDFFNDIKNIRNLIKEVLQYSILEEADEELIEFYEDLFEMSLKDFAQKYEVPSFITFQQKLKDYLKKYKNKLKRNKKVMTRGLIKGLSVGIDIYHGLYEVEFKHLLKLIYKIQVFEKFGTIPGTVINDVGFYLNKIEKNPLYPLIEDLFSYRGKYRHSKSHKQYDFQKKPGGFIFIIMKPNSPEEEILNPLEFWNELHVVMFEISHMVKDLGDFYKKRRNSPEIEKITAGYIRIWTELFQILAIGFIGHQINEAFKQNPTLKSFFENINL